MQQSMKVLRNDRRVKNSNKGGINIAKCPQTQLSTIPTAIHCYPPSIISNHPLYPTAYPPSITPNCPTYITTAPEQALQLLPAAITIAPITIAPCTEAA